MVILSTKAPLAMNSEELLVIKHKTPKLKSLVYAMKLNVSEVSTVSKTNSPKKLSFHSSLKVGENNSKKLMKIASKLISYTAEVCKSSTLIHIYAGIYDPTVSIQFVFYMF